PPPPPPAPAGRGARSRAPPPPPPPPPRGGPARVGVVSQAHQCCGPCGVHAHQHDIARRSSIPVSDENAFWGAFGCSCFSF
ncbi:amidohydrolase, partial [Serratia ureilytica]|nr:amidohydrolase [Serratia ureilytica]